MTAPSTTVRPGISSGGLSAATLNGGPALCVNGGRGVLGLNSPAHNTSEGPQGGHLIQIGEAA